MFVSLKFYGIRFGNVFKRCELYRNHWKGMSDTEGGSLSTRLATEIEFG